MKNNNKIKDMQLDYRPDEKFLSLGPDSLTAAELLAIILRTGIPGESSLELTQKLLYSSMGNCEDILKIFQLEYEDLLKIKGIGKVKALQIKAVAALSARIAASKTIKKITYNDPASVADHYMEQMRHRKNEVVILLLLNSAGMLIKDMILSEGTVKASFLSAREIFIQAVKNEAVNIIILHNHPSGVAKPSPSDIESTKAIYNVGKILGISLLDHIIIGDKEYCSLKEKGYINE